jgi:hypothetical protein
VCCTPEKVPAPWQGKINVHYSDDNDIKSMLTSIASTHPVPRNIIMIRNIMIEISDSTLQAIAGILQYQP